MDLSPLDGEDIYQVNLLAHVQPLDLNSGQSFAPSPTLLLWRFLGTMLAARPCWEKLSAGEQASADDEPQPEEQ